MHDSVNVLLYKQYLKKRKADATTFIIIIVHSLVFEGERANVLQCVEHTIMFK